MLSHPTIAVTLSPEVDLIWQKCHKLGNEMSVDTRARRIFPTLEYNITGLDPDSFYRISLHLDSNDNEKIYCPSGYWYSPVMTIYKNDMPIDTSCILHTVFKAVTYFHSKELRDYKSSLNKYAKAGFIMRRDSDQKMPFPAMELRRLAQGTSTTSENRSTAQFMSSTLSYPPISKVTPLPPTITHSRILGSTPFMKAQVTTLPPNVNSPRILRDVPMIPPTINPILFNMLPAYQNLNPLFNPFWNPLGNLFTNVFHSPAITPPTNFTDLADKATGDDDEEEEEVNVTDL